MISYFISYSWNTSKQHGNGCCEIKRDEKIKDYDDLKGIMTYLHDDLVKDEYGEKAKCVILSWKELGC